MKGFIDVETMKGRVLVNISQICTIEYAERYKTTISTAGNTCEVILTFEEICKLIEADQSE